MPTSEQTPPPILPRTIETIARTNAASKNGSEAKMKSTGWPAEGMQLSHRKIRLDRRVNVRVFLTFV